MTIKNFLLSAVALAIIGAGGSISMYYQMLRMEHTKKRELSDQYFSEKLTSLHGELLFAYGLRYEEYTANLACAKEEMHKDGYCYAEIDEIDKAADEKAYESAKATRQLAQQYKEKQQSNTAGRYEVRSS